MNVLTDKLGREILLGTAAWGLTAGSAAAVTPPPAGGSTTVVTFAGAAGAQPAGASAINWQQGGPGASALDGSGNYVLRPGCGNALFDAAGVQPDGAFTVTLAVPGRIGFMWHAASAGGLTCYYTGVPSEGTLGVYVNRNGSYSRTIGTTSGACPVGTVWKLTQAAGEFKISVDGVDAYTCADTALAPGAIGIRLMEGETRPVTVVGGLGLQPYVPPVAPPTLARTLGFNGPAGAPSGVEALTAVAGSPSIAQMVLTGSGALNLGNIELTDAILSGVGTVGNGTFTLNYAAGTSDKQARLSFGTYTWQNSFNNMELWGPGGMLCQIKVAPIASFGVSVNDGTALCLIDGKVAYTLNAPRDTLWGPLRTGTVVYSSGTLIDSLVIDPAPLPKPALAPLPVAPRQASTSVPSGYLLMNAQVATVPGTQIVASPGTLQTYALAGPDAGLFYMKSDGTLTTVQPLTLGDKHVTVVTTDLVTGTTRSDPLTIPVPQGNLIAAGSAGSVKLAIPQGLTNNPVAPVVGTPTCSGVTGTKVWTLANKDTSIGAYGGYFNRQIDCDATTGTVAFVQQAAARADGHTIVLSCSDGINTAIETFVIPVAFFVGPKVYVGPGNATTNPGYDHYFPHLEQLYPFIGQSYRQPDPAYAGARIFLDDGGDDNYFANDYGSDIRAMIHGPLRFFNIAGPTGRRVRLGGTIGAQSGGYNGGQDKAFTLCNGGDITFDSIRWAYVLGQGNPNDTIGGRTALRVNGGTNGDVTITNCQFDNCNNGFESGEGPNRITIKFTPFFNCGGMTQGAGQTHAAYINGAELIYQNNLSFNNNIGHCLKTRCMRGTITDNTLADGAGGSASQQLNIPQAGDYLVERNTFQKGPSSQNPACIGYGEDDYGRDRFDLLRVLNNTFVISSIDGAHNGSGVGIFHFPRVNTLNGGFSDVVADGNRWFFSNPATQVKFQRNSYPGDPNPNGWTETNSTILVAPPALNLADPGTANPPAAAPGHFIYLFYYGGDNYQFMDGVQITPSVKDIRVSAAAPAGTVLTLLTPYGNDLVKNLGVPNDIRVNPFVAGSTWRISTDPEYFAGAVWPPAGRYTIVPSSDGTTATLKTGTGLVANRIDTPKIEVTAPNGTKAAWRIPVSVLA